ncbi:MAG: hypothetical protein SRB2_03895 [Desulfobacteraceae bacterium Eth-SRB2]|nr:MAG: hypothetical protein SRB2_03895 [Desulfobacteraceae bacterium Eth-SRB2]
MNCKVQPEFGELTKHLRLKGTFQSFSIYRSHRINDYPRGYRRRGSPGILDLLALLQFWPTANWAIRTRVFTQLSKLQKETLRV